MTIYENIERERERIQKCISTFGHTSDHNLDWFACVMITPDGVPMFVEWPDGTGLLVHKYENEWRIWSDPLSPEGDMAGRVAEFALSVFKNDGKPPHQTKSDALHLRNQNSSLWCGGKIKSVWCDDTSDKIYPALQKTKGLKLDKIYYSLLWPVMDMTLYDPLLPGGHFKEMRNSKNKFYREHEVKILKTGEVAKADLLKIVDAWRDELTKKEKEDIYDLRYRLLIDKNFRGFTTSRVMVVDGRPRGFNAGYEVPNRPGRFACAVGIHDYSIKDLGNMLWLEDLEWIKNAGYKELDMQGDEYEWEIKSKTQYGNTVIERKSDTFSIQRTSLQT